jgi:hypothetical protein
MSRMSEHGMGPAYAATRADTSPRPPVARRLEVPRTLRPDPLRKRSRPERHDPVSTKATMHRFWRSSGRTLGNLTSDTLESVR